MKQAPDLNQYWGVVLRSAQFDHFRMSLAMNLYWTLGGEVHENTLQFHGVRDLRFYAEKTYPSEVVELISLEARVTGELYDVVGELSNYSFSIVCAEIREGRSS